MLEIIYQDEYIIAINKPSGLLSIPDGYTLDLPNLQSLLKKEVGPVWTVHRLDKDTSGAILFAFSAFAKREMSLLYEHRKVENNYRALVHGPKIETRFVIDQPLRVNGDRHHRTVIDPINGKPAQTEVILQKQLDSTAIIDAFPRTGYTHQIRAHLAYHGIPIVNDALYGGISSRKPIPFPTDRLMLHAVKISFIHPFSGQHTEITAPFPPELADLAI